MASIDDATPQQWDALKTQEGGDHYMTQAIQPVEYIVANKLDFNEGNVVKYVTRHKDKNGLEDIKKAIQYLQFIAHFDYGVTI